MLALRGKKEYLDDVETYHIWQGIKSNSNPYNYIVWSLIELITLSF